MKHKTKLQLLLLLGQDLKDRNSSTYFVFCYLLLLYVVEIKETVIMFCMQNLSNFSISSIVSSSCSVSILGTLLESTAVVACNEVGRQAGNSPMASPATAAAASRFCIQVTCCIQMGRSDCVQDTTTYYAVYLVKKVVSTSKQSVRCTWAK